MRNPYLLILVLFFSGCADVAENPTDEANYQPIPKDVQDIIQENCASCHQPESLVVFKGQMPYFAFSFSPTDAIILDTIQIWLAKERIGIRVKEGTMPRLSDTSDVFFPLPDDKKDIIVIWSEG
ncbi:MAG: hypothetical protein IH825_01980 [Candidatus Marinimicrobia bacterium]|nr:hypothetical protein [Candidatus Neomarinimicrobiota bacterium]